MSGYMGKFFTAVSAALEFNTATLSGAIDIVVIEDDQGRRHCSPFHVRFGKLQLLKSRGIPVEIEINGQRTDLRMLLGAAGEAYFYDFKNARKDDGDGNPSENDPSSSTNLADQLRAEVERLDIPSITYPSSDSDAVLAMLHSPSMQGISRPPFTPNSGLSDDLSQSEDLSARKNDRNGTRKPSDSQSNLPSRVLETKTSDYPFGYISDSEVELTRNERAGTTEVVDEPRSPPILPSQRKWSFIAQKPPTTNLSDIFDETLEKKPVASFPQSEESGDTSEDQHSALFGLPASPSKRQARENDTSQFKESECSKSPTSPQDESLKHIVQPPHEENKEGVKLGRHSTSRMEESHTVPVCINDIVGEEEGKMDCRSVDGYEADEDDAHDLQKQIAYVLSRPKSLPTEGNQKELGAHATSISNPALQRRDTASASNDHSKERLPLQEGLMSMSMCGSLLHDEMEEAQIMELFQRHQVSFEEFAGNPNILHEPSLLFRIDNRLVELRVALPFIFAALAFNEKLDIDFLAKLTTPDLKEVDKAPKSPPTPSRRFTWFGWASPKVVGEPLLQEEDLNVLDTTTEVDKKPSSETGDAPQSNTVIHSTLSSGVPKEDEEYQTNMTSGNAHEGTENVNSADIHGERELPDAFTEDIPVDADDQSAPLTNSNAPDEPTPIQPAIPFVSFADLDPDALSLRPTPEELKRLDLKPGANTIRFVVESSDVELNCRVFLWSCHTKIVISDVDGTITRSDVLGHLLPAVGRDWSQVGVAGLYSQIERNGYRMLYLTARPIGQASQTRAFLHSVTQGSAKLPNGPVLMSPNRLVESFTREVIRRKPQEFKIAALREIRCLFAPDYNPFHAGFGNRDTDVISYRAVGLIPQRIFVVNPKGELVVMKAKYESAATYSTLQDLVESVFPDISGHTGLKKIQALTESATFNDWNYWKEGLPEIDIDKLLNPT